MDEVIYVRGVDIGVDRVWQNAHPRTKRANTTLTFFDFVAQKKRVWNRWDGGQPPPAALDKENDIASVIDLYDHIKAAASRSVIELHFFTHAFEGGPVLYNTFDNSMDPAARDPNDKDPRIKDFSIRTVLGASEGRRFAGALAANALIKLWGCTHREDFRQKIRRDFYRAKSADARKVIKETYQDFIRDGTYQYSLHRATGRPVYAAPLGWGTNPYLPFDIHGAAAEKSKPKYVGRWPPKKGDQWWRVSQYFRPDRGREFYATELNARFDILDYVAYEDRIVRKP